MKFLKSICFSAQFQVHLFVTELSEELTNISLDKINLFSKIGELSITFFCSLIFGLFKEPM